MFEGVGIILLIGLFVACSPVALAIFSFVSGQTLAKTFTRTKVKQLQNSLIAGLILTTFLLLSSVYLLAAQMVETGLLREELSLIIIATWLFEGFWLLLWTLTAKPDQLWLGQTSRQFLTKRAQKVTNQAEAFSLGVSTILFQLPVWIAPIFGAAFLVFKQNSVLLALNYQLSLSLLAASVVLQLACLIAKISFCRKASGAKLAKFSLTYRPFFHYLASFALILAAIFLLVQELTW